MNSPEEKNEDKKPGTAGAPAADAPAPLLKYRVEKTPPGQVALKVGNVYCAVGAEPNVTKTRAKAINDELPGALVFIGA